MSCLCPFIDTRYALNLNCRCYIDYHIKQFSLCYFVSYSYNMLKRNFEYILINVFIPKLHQLQLHFMSNNFMSNNIFI